MYSDSIPLTRLRREPEEGGSSRIQRVQWAFRGRRGGRGSFQKDCSKKTYFSLQPERHTV